MIGEELVFLGFFYANVKRKHCFCMEASVFHLCEGDKMIKEIITQLFAALDYI